MNSISRIFFQALWIELQSNFVKFGKFPTGGFIDFFFYFFCKYNLVGLFSECLFHFVVFMCIVVVTSSDDFTYVRAHTCGHFNHLVLFSSFSISCGRQCEILFLDCQLQTFCCSWTCSWWNSSSSHRVYWLVLAHLQSCFQ
jgi:hypothetical protein